MVKCSRCFQKLYAEMVRTPSNIRATNGKSQSIYPDEVVDAASMVPPIKAVAGIPSHTSDDVYSNDAHNVNRVPLWHDRMCTTRCKRDELVAKYCCASPSLRSPFCSYSLFKLPRWKPSLFLKELGSLVVL